MPTERPLREQIAQALAEAEDPLRARVLGARWCLPAADVVLPIIERERADERVRVVEGLVATIKALGAKYDQFRYGGGPYSYRGAIDDVLAVVEAAREVSELVLVGLRHALVAAQDGQMPDDHYTAALDLADAEDDES